MKIKLIIASFFFLSCLTAFPQTESILSVDAVPYGTLPAGSSSDLFRFGFGTALEASYIPGSMKIVGINGGIDFLNLPLQTNDSVWAASLFAGPSLRFPLGERLSAFSTARAGYYNWGGSGWESESSSSGGFVLGGTVGALFKVSGNFTLGAGITYSYYSDLYNGIGFSIRASYDRPGLEKLKSPLEIDNIQLLPLYPVLYRYYDNHKVGSINIRNTGKKTVDNIAVSFFVERYMDNPSQNSGTLSLKPGEEKTVDLYGLFTEDLMEITEGTAVSALISVSHPSGKDQVEKKATDSIEFRNRNALSWDDDRKIASFITAKDPQIMNFAKRVASWMQDVKNPALDENFQKGVAIFEAVRTYGIRYEIDPATPFSEFSEEETAIDFLQFPRQTLQYSNGDCDDLTSLFCSLLEAVGVETSFITVPGHIYAAFALSTPVSDLEQTFSDKRELIISNGKAWVPVEITMTRESFETAWREGAKEWREAVSSEQGLLYPTREAWAVYPAVGFREGGESLVLPNREEVNESFSSVIARYVEREMYPRLAVIQDNLKKVQGSARIRNLNKLSVLYARYGLYDKASENLEELVRTNEYPPALANMGNLYFIQNEYEKALGFYNRALEADTGSVPAMVGIARCSYKLENYGTVKKIYTTLKESYPEIAERYSYLEIRGEEAERASSAVTGTSGILWEEE